MFTGIFGKWNTVTIPLYSLSPQEPKKSSPATGTACLGATDRSSDFAVC